MKKERKRIHGKTVKELEKDVSTTRQNIVKARLEWKANKPKDTNAISKLKRQLSMTLTVLGEKQDQEKLSTKK